MAAAPDPGFHPAGEEDGRQPMNLLSYEGDIVYSGRIFNELGIREATLADVRAWCTEQGLVVTSERFWDAAGDAIRYMAKELQVKKAEVGR